MQLKVVIITALMDHLDALVQIHTNAQLGQLAQSQQGTNFFSFSR
jgi:hypothetical protein